MQALNEACSTKIIAYLLCELLCIYLNERRLGVNRYSKYFSIK